MARKPMTQRKGNMPANRPTRYPAGSLVRVRPIRDVAKQFVRHPVVGGFTGGDEGTTWPLDQFTMRRLRDGDIEIVKQQEESQESQQSARMTKKSSSIE
jgi:hypothetical protein